MFSRNKIGSDSKAKEINETVEDFSGHRWMMAQNPEFETTGAELVDIDSHESEIEDPQQRIFTDKHREKVLATFRRKQITSILLCIGILIIS